MKALIISVMVSLVGAYIAGFTRGYAVGSTNGYLSGIHCVTAHDVCYGSYGAKGLATPDHWVTK